MTARTITTLPDDVRSKVVAAVLFGYTKNLQNHGIIPSYPKEDTKIFCAVGDTVCDGTLVITVAHLSYADDAQKAANFYADRINAAKAAGGNTDSSSGDDN
jgi:cutinase